MKTLLKQIEEAYVYRLDWIDNQIHIFIEGYYYKAEEPEFEEKNWRHVMFRGYEMPLSEFRASFVDNWSRWEEEYTRWLDDLTEEEVIERFTEDNAPISRPTEDITEADAHAYCECQFIDAVYNI